MTYQETVDWMFVQLPMYQREGKTAFRPKLANTLALDAHLGHPHNRFKSIHVAGTNGKGSTSHMIASILQEAGYKVGLYTSPHLKDFRERIKVNGEMIPEAAVVDFVAGHMEFFKAHQCSFFEMTVGLAFDYFARAGVDFAVIEVGLGGRLDSTNIITPEVSVITNIGFDHMDFLGDTLEKIAAEKAGIIKPGVPVVISEYQEETWPVFREKARVENAEVVMAPELDDTYRTDLKGKYQDKNLRAAVGAVKTLQGVQIPDDIVRAGLLKTIENTGLLGRWQVLQTSPKVICDTAHNKEGLSLVMEQLKEEDYEQLHIVLGVVKDKALDLILPLFPSEGVQYYFTAPDIPRKLEAKELQGKAAEFGMNGGVYSSVTEALEVACKQATTNDLVFVGGSTFTVAEIV